MISSIFSFIFSIATALTASSCPIDIEDVKLKLKERHAKLKEITSTNCHSKAFKDVISMTKKMKLWREEKFSDDFYEEN